MIPSPFDIQELSARILAGERIITVQLNLIEKMKKLQKKFLARKNFEIYGSSPKKLVKQNSLKRNGHHWPQCFINIWLLYYVIIHLLALMRMTNKEGMQFSDM